MIRSLQVKIVLSLSLLVLMLLAAAAMSMLEFRKMGSSMDTVMKNNFRSVETANKMMHSLERCDRDLLLWMVGDVENVVGNIQLSHQMVLNAIEEGSGNITETGEKEYLSDIIYTYNLYHNSVQKIIQLDTSTDSVKKEYYFVTRSLFLQTQKTIEKLISLNHDQMLRQTQIFKENSHRAMMPAIISVTVGIIFALLLLYFITLYFIRPLKQLTIKIMDYYPEQGRISSNIDNSYEFQKIENEINNLIYRLLRKRTND